MRARARMCVCVCVCVCVLLVVVVAVVGVVVAVVVVVDRRLRTVVEARVQLIAGSRENRREVIDLWG